MANYAVNKARFGGMVGSIQVFTNTLPAGNDPNSGEFRTQLPAGFLRCDGSILKADRFPALAEVLGIGQDCKFAKDRTTIQDDEFQLPDIGSKYIIPGRASGTYLQTTLSDGTTRRVGAEFDVTSNVGTSETIGWSGEFKINARTDDVLGNPFYKMDQETFTGFITGSSFQGHGHLANQQVLNCTGNYLVSSAVGPEDGNQTHSGNNCKPYGGNLLYNLAAPDGSSSLSASHEHRIGAPTSQSDYTHNFEYTMNQISIPTTNVRTTVNITTQPVTTFDSTIQPFIIVEYIIKF
jgi:hypothetical protein